MQSSTFGCAWQFEKCKSAPLFHCSAYDCFSEVQWIRMLSPEKFPGEVGLKGVRCRLIFISKTVRFPS